MYTYIYANGRYEGGFEFGQKSGYGKYVWTNGDVYVGYWAFGTKSGYGELKNAQGAIFYAGEWKNGHRANPDLPDSRK